MPRPRAAAPGVVLQQMVRAGDITEAQAQAADVADLKLTPERQQNSARYFTDWALPQLDTLIDETSAPLEVWTTLDPAMQREADAAIRANAPNGVQGALVSLDRDGGVRAMVGGKDYVTSIYNRATQAVRQPGSAFKAVRLSRRAGAGHKPEDTIVDEPVTIDGGARATIRGAIRAVSLRTRLRLFAEYGGGEAGAGSGLFHHRRDGAALRHHDAESTRIPRWCWAPATCG